MTLKKTASDNKAGKAKNADTNIFSFSLNVSYPITDRNHTLSYIHFVFCKYCILILSRSERFLICKYLILCSLMIKIYGYFSLFFIKVPIVPN